MDTLTRERRHELLDVLKEIQNRPEHEHHDIMTITGFMQTEHEIVAHIKRMTSR